MLRASARPGPGGLIAARPARRAVLRGGAATAGALATLSLSADASRWHAHVPLLSETVALHAPGERIVVRPGRASEVRSATRIARDAEDAARLEAEEAPVRDAVAMASAHWAATDRELLLGAALDLHVLSAGLAAPVASWNRSWRYVWPRDAAHVAVAFAHLGLIERAAGVVRELARLCGAAGEEAGWFEARYVAGRRSAPDARRRQLDGTGWFLWAADVVTTARPELRDEEPVQAAARRAAALLLRLTEDGSALPPASPDYWEVTEKEPTVATCAAVAMGLERATTMLTDASLAARCAQAATALRARIARAFGSTGYGRYPGRVGADAGMTFLLPPYAMREDEAVRAQLDATQRALSRAGGGLSPGALWRDDGVSWTPETALVGQARACGGDPEGASEVLAWLGAHRTRAGSLPEKVLADGAPASVAPLAWTAALLVGTAVRIHST